ncbi:MAG: hydroxymethylbilane synthase [Oscillospiraceae bacterium]|nr:hydroxymethylbilane synthase [Oscillospiraceae bacterium]
MKIKIGTRKSSLALAQTDMVIKSLHDVFPDIETEIVHITTKGDKILDKPLARIGGKGVFVSEIESALKSGEIDIAVHSAKDLPYKLAENLEISGVLKRGNYRDVLVTPAGKVPEKDSKFIVGTGSQRRRLNMQRIYPNAVFKEIRGNVDTRLRKLKSGEFDGIILAAAGLERLGLYSSGV